jgi:antirestriction protein ArdC
VLCRYRHKAHWAGAEHRLNRDFGQRFGDDQYAIEELVAELSASLLCAELAISNSPRPDHAQYLAHWLKVLKADKRAIFTAASQATRCVTYLAGLQPADAQDRLVGARAANGEAPAITATS